jgi:hypothetical protein
VEDYETNTEEIGRTVKIKHTKKQGKKYKIQREIKHQTINQRGLDKIWPEAPLRKVVMGERRGGDVQMTCHMRRAMKTPKSGRPKQGKKPTTRKKKGREKRGKKKGGTSRLGHQVNN